MDVLITASTATDEAGTVVGQSVDRPRRHVAAQRPAGAGGEPAPAGRSPAHRSPRKLRIRSGHRRDRPGRRSCTGSSGSTRPSKPSGDVVVSMVHPDDLPALAQQWADAAERGVPYDVVYRIIRPDSMERCVHARAVPEVAEDGTVVQAGRHPDGRHRTGRGRPGAASGRDPLRDRLRTGGDRRRHRRSRRAVPIRVNPAVCSLLGRPAELLVGRRWAEYTHPDDVPLWQAVLAPAGRRPRHLRGRTALPAARWHAWCGRRATSPWCGTSRANPQYFFAQFQDITERKQMEQELAHQALHDSLTGLPNRALLTDRLVHGLAGSRRRGSQLGVMFLDLDHFKVVNDSLGHTCGDDLLRQAAARIAGRDPGRRHRGPIRRRRVRGRLRRRRRGRDRADRRAGPRGAEPAVPDRRPGDERHRQRGHRHRRRAATPESLLRDSDAAMYRAKERGGAASRCSTTRCDPRSSDGWPRHRRCSGPSIATSSPSTTSRSWTCSTGAMVSAEALLRWQHPDRGPGRPRTSSSRWPRRPASSCPIGAWVLEQACRQLVRVAAHRRQSMSVAVNLSVRQMLAPDIAGWSTMSCGAPGCARQTSAWR